MNNFISLYACIFSWHHQVCCAWARKLTKKPFATENPSTSYLTWWVQNSSYNSKLMTKIACRSCKIHPIWQWTSWNLVSLMPCCASRIRRSSVRTMSSRKLTYLLPYFHSQLVLCHLTIHLNVLTSTSFIISKILPWISSKYTQIVRSSFSASFKNMNERISFTNSDHNLKKGRPFKIIKGIIFIWFLKKSYLRSKMHKLAPNFYLSDFMKFWNGNISINNQL